MIFPHTADYICYMWSSITYLLVTIYILCYSCSYEEISWRGHCSCAIEGVIACMVMCVCWLGVQFDLTYTLFYQDNVLKPYTCPVIWRPWLLQATLIPPALTHTWFSLVLQVTFVKCDQVYLYVIKYIILAESQSILSHTLNWWKLIGVKSLNLDEVRLKRGTLNMEWGQIAA